MKQKKQTPPIRICCLLLILLLSLPAVLPLFVGAESSDGGEPVTAISGGGELTVDDVPYYRDIEVPQTSGYTGGAIEVPAKEYVSDNAVFETEIRLDGKDYTGLVWDKKQENATWGFDVPQDALYQITVEYYPLPGSGLAATRRLYIDDNSSFKEAYSIGFPRMWKDSRKPLTDNLGDEVKPFAEEVQGLVSTCLSDSDGRTNAPFSFYLTAGKHTLRLSYIDQPMLITRFIIEGVSEIPTYKEKQAQYKAEGKTAFGETVSFEAEDFSKVQSRNDSIIGVEAGGDPGMVPSSLHNIKMNYIGGWNFRFGNQEITWRFAVKKSGLYKIGFRVGQQWNDGLPSFRQILIDGEIPFKEWECYTFKYDSNGYTETLSSAAGEAYNIWLDEGEHTLTMTVKLGEYGRVIEKLSGMSLSYSALTRKIKKITGEYPDVNYDYEIEKNVPGIKEELESIKAGLIECRDIVETAAGKKTSTSNDLGSVITQTERLIRDPELIPRRFSDMENALSSMGNWINTMRENPLAVDTVWISSPESEIPSRKASFFKKLYFSAVKFVGSFTRDYNAVASVEGAQNAKKEITVWAGRGKEWTSLIKQLADAEFTPESGVRIKLNTIPAAQLSAGAGNNIVLAMASGTAPDVVLGVGSSFPVEYAIRNAVLDLSGMEGFSEVKGQFFPELFRPLTYKNGIYALPETLNYRCMFYRTDIFGELGLIPPDTWEEMYKTTLPVLFQNGLSCFVPMQYDYFLFQRNGDYYTGDGMKTALNSPAAFQAFKECCELYTNYGLPVAANFFNRFRSGEIPFGMGTFAEYMTITTAAPELAGSWTIAPIPGTPRGDGTIDRSSAGITGETAFILAQSEKTKEAWAFLKWWTAADTQTLYARLIESQLGVNARYHSANIEAFRQLPYSEKEFLVLENFVENAREIDVVLGGYYTPRLIYNAWNRTVIGGKDARDSFEQAVEEIAVELKRRQEEYNIFVE